MPVYSYKGYDSSGIDEVGSIDVSCEKVAFDTLVSRGITVVELSKGQVQNNAGVPWYRRDIRLRRAELSYQEQAKVAGLLATLFQAKLSVSEIVRVAILSSDNMQVRRHFERVDQYVSDGMSFSDAFENGSNLFSPVFTSLLRTSDAANSLPTMLKELSRFFQHHSQIRQKVITALIYPCILLCAAFALFLIIVFYLAPNLQPIFSAAGRSAPETIQFLLWINTILEKYWLPVSSALVFIAFGFVVGAQSPRTRKLLQKNKLNIPIIGPLLYLSLLSGLVQSTEMLLRSGRSLSDALRLSTKNIGSDSVLGALFVEAADSVEAGRSASTVFDSDARMPPPFKELFRVGEQSNNLPVVLAALSEHIAANVEGKTQRMLNMLTPILTLVLGLGIGALVYSIMSAILEVNEIAF